MKKIYSKLLVSTMLLTTVSTSLSLDSIAVHAQEEGNREINTYGSILGASVYREAIPMGEDYVLEYDYDGDQLTRNDVEKWTYNGEPTFNLTGIADYKGVWGKEPISKTSYNHSPEMIIAFHYLTENYDRMNDFERSGVVIYMRQHGGKELDFGQDKPLNYDKAHPDVVKGHKNVSSYVEDFLQNNKGETSDLYFTGSSNNYSSTFGQNKDVYHFKIDEIGADYQLAEGVNIPGLLGVEQDQNDESVINVVVDPGTNLSGQLVLEPVEGSPSYGGISYVQNGWWDLIPLSAGYKLPKNDIVINFNNGEVGTSDHVHIGDFPSFDYDELEPSFTDLFTTTVDKQETEPINFEYPNSNSPKLLDEYSNNTVLHRINGKLAVTLDPTYVFSPQIDKVSGVSVDSETQFTRDTIRGLDLLPRVIDMGNNEEIYGAQIALWQTLKTPPITGFTGGSTDVVNGYQKMKTAIENPPIASNYHYMYENKVIEDFYDDGSTFVVNDFIGTPKTKEGNVMFNNQKSQIKRTFDKDMNELDERIGVGQYAEDLGSIGITTDVPEGSTTPHPPSELYVETAPTEGHPSNGYTFLYETSHGPLVILGENILYPVDTTLLHFKDGEFIPDESIGQGYDFKDTEGPTDYDRAYEEYIDTWGEPHKWFNIPQSTPSIDKGEDDISDTPGGESSEQTETEDQTNPNNTENQPDVDSEPTIPETPLEEDDNTTPTNPEPTQPETEDSSEDNSSEAVENNDSERNEDTQSDNNTNTEENTSPKEETDNSTSDITNPNSESEGSEEGSQQNNNNSDSSNDTSPNTEEDISNPDEQLGDNNLNDRSEEDDSDSERDIDNSPENDDSNSEDEDSGRIRRLSGDQFEPNPSLEDTSINHSNGNDFDSSEHEDGSISDLNNNSDTNTENDNRSDVSSSEEEVGIKTGIGEQDKTVVPIATAVSGLLLSGLAGLFAWKKKNN